ncbi:MAG: hypothetical protein HY560_01270 [Gemmatimonadetes bacterium]|nr:hypothetical protein [Gemmatimonadota bacterium]
MVERIWHALEIPAEYGSLAEALAAGAAAGIIGSCTVATHATAKLYASQHWPERNVVMVRQHELERIAAAVLEGERQAKKKTAGLERAHRIAEYNEALAEIQRTTNAEVAAVARELKL